MVQNKSLLEIQIINHRKRVFRKLIFLFIFMIITTNLLSSFLLKHSGIEIMAHRGSTVFSPENTISSAVEAIIFGYSFIEIDVQMTKDNKVILLHDSTFKRVAGIKAYPRNLLYSEIQELNVGHYKSSLTHYESPLLADVLKICKGRIKLNIELKNYTGNTNLPFEVVSLIQKYDMESDCIITSSSLTLLRNVHDLTPNIPLGIIINTPAKIYSKIPDYITIYSINYLILTPNISLYLKSKGKTIFSWTVNHSVSINMSLSAGASAIITDNLFLAKLYVLNNETLGLDINSLKEKIDEFLEKEGLIN